MRYKLTMACLTILSLNATAASWPYDNETLRNNMNIAYDSLNTKVDYCRSLKNRKLIPIDVNWLSDMPLLKQKVALHVVSRIVFDQCIEQEQIAYTMALMNYTSETEDKSFLNQWVILNKSYYGNDTFALLSDIPPERIIELSKLPDLRQPFLAREAYKVIVQ